MNNPKLDFGNKHVLKLIARDADPTGWTKVSETLFNTLSATTPEELAEFEKLEIGGRVRLTTEGKMVVYAMGWL